MNENEQDLLRRLLVDLFLANPRKATRPSRVDDRERVTENASSSVKGQENNNRERESRNGKSKESKKRIHDRGII